MSESGWQEWRLETVAQQVESLEEWLFEHGALSVSLEDNADEPLLEPGPGETPLWQHVKVAGLFASDVDLAPLKAALPRHLVSENSKSDVAFVADRAWERVWMEDFSPIQMGSRLWICPSWTHPPDDQAANVYLDPGLAFGTGSHATTAMCLSALDSSLQAGERVVDFGCGSGILAIAALRLGADRALGVDNDPQALAASRSNAERNNVQRERFEVVMPGDPAIDAWRDRADRVVANILAGPLLDLADELMGLVKPGGTVMLTGVLESQTDQLIARYQAINLLPIDRRDGWVLLAGMRAV